MQTLRIETKNAWEIGVNEPVTEAIIDSDMICIHSDGSKTPLFLLQSWADEIPKIQRMAELLGPDQPVYAVNPPRGDKPEDFPRRAPIWSDYCLERLDRLEYSGPWILGGWSFGGTLAMGVAQSLIGRGEEVRLVLLLDSALPRSPSSAKRVSRTGLLERSVRSANKYYETPIDQRGNFMAEKIKWWKIKIGRTLRGGTKKWVEDRRRRMGLLHRSLHVSYLNYEPFYSEAPAYLLWTEESMGKTHDVTLGWQRYHRGPFFSEMTDGGHVSMWDEPNIVRLAQLAEKALRFCR